MLREKPTNCCRRKIKEEIKMTDCDNKRPCAEHRNNNKNVCRGVILGALSQKQRGEFNVIKRLTKRIISFTITLAMAVALLLQL